MSSVHLASVSICESSPRWFLPGYILIHDWVGTFFLSTGIFFHWGCCSLPALIFFFSLHCPSSEKNPKIQAAGPQHPGSQEGRSAVGEAQVFAREEQGQMERQVREDGGHSCQRAEERNQPQRRKIGH